jgi:SulP family sulfate permease
LKTVADIASISGGFPPFHIPDITKLRNLENNFSYALIMASVGLTEDYLL